MKICEVCQAEIFNGSSICTNCGSYNIIESCEYNDVTICEICQAEIFDGSTICPNCGYHNIVESCEYNDATIYEECQTEISNISTDRLNYSKTEKSQQDFKLSDDMSTQERIEHTYKFFTQSLEQVLFDFSDIEGSNNDLKHIQKSLSEIISQRYNEIQVESKITIESTVWDNLVIAFFGETNAGKSTIIESFRIKFKDTTRETSFSQSGGYEDGLIVGDGRSDFTKSYNEYNLHVNNQPFTLIDVPGIEGEEDDFKDDIKKALNKAHIVFYVQGHNKQPDTATANKIKKYLRDWVNVYSIYNVRGGTSNYDEPDERETLLTKNVMSTETLIEGVFKNALAENYKGNITIQGLLSLCSLANFSDQRADLTRTQSKLLKYFGSREQIYDFACFDDLAEIVEGKSKSFMVEIVEANKQKIISMARESYNAIKDELNKQSQNIYNLKSALNRFDDDIVTIYNDGTHNIMRDVSSSVEYEFKQFKYQVYELIDNDVPNKEDNIKAIQAYLASKINRSIEQATSKNIEFIKKKIDIKKRNLDSFVFKAQINNLLYSQQSSINSQEFLSELGIQFSDVGGFAASVASGALTGSCFTWIAPGVATAIGAVVGGAIHITKSLIFGDGGRSKAKEAASKQIDIAMDETLKSVRQITSKTVSQLLVEKNNMHKSISKEIDKLDKTEAVIKSNQTAIRKFINEIKNKDYEII